MVVLPSQKINEIRTKKGILTLYTSLHEDLQGPLSIVLDAQSNLIVTEEFGHRLTKLDHNFTCIWSIGRKGNKKSEFFYPTGVVVDTDNNYYVTDRWNHRIQKFDERGNFLLQFGTYGNKEGQLNEPWGIALLSIHDIVVVDRGNARLVVFDKNGNFKTQFGQCGTSTDFYESERFKRNFHFQNWLNNVYKLNTIESRFYEFKYEVGELEYPEDVSIDPVGNIYVTDRVSGHVVIFDTTFSLKTVLSEHMGIAIPPEPSAVFAYEGGYFIAGESNEMLYWCYKTEHVVFDLREFGIRISDVYYEKSKNLLYVTDVWNNTISLFYIESIS